MPEPSVAKLEADVEYIKRDIGEITSDIKSIDGRLAGIEDSVISAKTAVKAFGVAMAGTFTVCTYLFGTYISKMADALNLIVLK